MGPNADLKKFEEEQMGIATVRFGAKDAKEKSKQKQYEMVMDEEISFVLAETIAGNRDKKEETKDLGPTEEERRKMDLQETRRSLPIYP